ncbi:hypothetical protein D3C76_1545200 [compost metagenome]
MPVCKNIPCPRLQLIQLDVLLHLSAGKLVERAEYMRHGYSTRAPVKGIPLLRNTLQLAARLCLPLQHGHLPALCRQRDCTGQAAEAGADNNRLLVQRYRLPFHS